MANISNEPPVEQWGMFELALQGSSAGNPFLEVELSVQFLHSQHIQNNGGDKVDLGQVAIPTGNSTLTLRATAGTGFTMQLYSLELVPASVQAQVNAAVQSGRSTATWLKNSPVGAMYQWGQWGARSRGAVIWDPSTALACWQPKLARTRAALSAFRRAMAWGASHSHPGTFRKQAHPL